MQCFVNPPKPKTRPWLAFGVWPLAAILLSLLTTQVVAQTPQPDIRLVIDVSGSMKRNDPHDLRQPAVELLVRLMPEGGKAGVWTFGKYVNMLVPHQPVDEAWRALARSKSSEINSAGLYTNIGEALEKAAFDVGSAPRKEFATSIILLTDGMVDISKQPTDNKKELRRIVDEVLPSLKQADYTIHTVALSDNADSALMEKLALATGGTAAVARSAEDLLKIFLQAFEVAAPAQALPLQNNRFAVDSSIEEFTALIFRQNPQQQTQLTGPDQQVYSAQSSQEDVTWFRSERYDLITVSQPLEGEWQIIADIEPASRITVVSDLTMRVKQLPSNAYRGAEETLSFLFQEQGQTLTSADFLSLLELEATLEFGAGDADLQPIWRHRFDAAQVPASGIYTVELPGLKDIGLYRLNLIADGKTFQRQFSHRISVREPFTASIEDNLEQTNGAQYVLTVRSHSDLVDPKRTQIAASIIKPDKRALVKPLGVTEQDRWQTLLHMDQLGQYQVTVQVTGEDSDQKPFAYTLKPLLLEHNPDAAFEALDPAVEPAIESAPAPALPAPEPLVEETIPPEVESEPEGTAQWVRYLLLALANVALIGGGYVLYRKLSGANESDAEVDLAEVDDLLADEAVQPTADSVSEEEPPMEDLDVDVEPDAGADGAGTAAADIEEFDDFDDFDEVALGGDDADEGEGELQAAPEQAAEAEHESVPLVDQIADDASDEERADFADEILRAQGLDLAEDELDDAISSLIEELDGSRAAEDDVSNDEESPER